MSTIHRKGFEHATSRPTQSPHPHGSPKGLRRSRCKVIEHDSSSGVVAFQPFIRRAFDEHSPVSSSSTRAPGRNLPLIRLKNSADRCKRAPTRRSQPLLLLLLFLFLSSSSFSNSFTFELRSTSNQSPLFRGTKGPTPERNSIESLITNRIARDTDSLINPMMNLSTPGNDRHCRFSSSWDDERNIGRLEEDLEIRKLWNSSMWYVIRIIVRENCLFVGNEISEIFLLNFLYRNYYWHFQREIINFPRYIHIYRIILFICLLI